LSCLEASKELPLILSLDTSSKVTSIALSRGDEIIESYASNLDERRSERLWAEIGHMLDKAGVSINEIRLFAVCLGPGGFTGLRVGLAAAKAFAMATGRPMVGVTSLEASALGPGAGLRVYSMVNAYKGEVYCQLFEIDSEGFPAPAGKAEALKVEQAVERVAKISPLVFTGDAVDAARELIEKYRECGLDWSIEKLDAPLAVKVSRIASNRFKRGQLDSPEGLGACYIRPAEAEIKLSQGLLGSKIQRNIRSK
jgi:tRNA threonylcarbamoyladenosine biosynthesis protein TsaB